MHSCLGLGTSPGNRVTGSLTSKIIIKLVVSLSANKQPIHLVWFSWNFNQMFCRWPPCQQIG